MLNSMTLLDAQQYDSAREHRRQQLIIVVVIAALLGGWLAYHFRDHGARVSVRRFFADLQKQDYEAAYSIWFHDPNWKQHPAKYPSYQFNDFYRDWGPGGEWGLIKSYHVDCSLNPSGGNGVIVQVNVNHRADHAYVWADKADKTLSFSPHEIDCGNWWGWLLE